jgi:hypothetical protein
MPHDVQVNADLLCDIVAILSVAVNKIHCIIEENTSSTLALYSEYPRFKPRLGLLHDFPQSLQEKFRIELEIRPQLLTSTFFPVHYLSIIVPFGTI